MPAPRASRPGAAPAADEPTTPQPPAAKGSRDRLRISGISVVAGAAAAATASAATSVLGVAGTVVGAAVVSAVITIAAAVYDHSLRAAKLRLAERIEVTARLPRLRADGSVDTDHEATGESAATRAILASFSAPLEATAEGVDGPSTGELAAAIGAESTAELPTRTEPGERPDPPLAALDLEDERGYHWGRIALVSLVVFALAMAVVTGFELVTGRPLSSLFTDSPAGGTTVGRIVRPHHGGSSTPAPTPTTPAPTPTTPSPTPTTPSPSPTTPTPSPTLTSATPSPSPTGTTSPSPAGTTSPTAAASRPASASPSGRPG